jgi:hypothetical protein
MELLQLLGYLFDAVQNIKSLEQAVEGEMYTILTAIGDNHYSAAIRALRDASKSSNPTREVESAITHLRGAYEAYLKNTKNSIFRYGFINRGKGPKEHKKCCEISTVMAVCYTYLREAELSKECLNRSQKHFNSYAVQTIEVIDNRIKGTYFNFKFGGGLRDTYKKERASEKEKIRVERAALKEFIDAALKRSSLMKRRRSPTTKGKRLR